ncbi:MAG TPA: flagellar basal-body MS-ring/collar protein FliF [Polyangiaceae bacterium]|nr:flagellar basal-body MS-ring/collar protein FliF [Polyangiaceae bacterium]
MINRLKQVAARLRAERARPRAASQFLKSLMPLVLLAAGITALIMLYLCRDQADYKPLFGAREKVAAADMMAALDGAGIAYRIHPESGQVLVRSSEIGKVRMLLASKGIVAKLPAGLELVDDDQPLGVSQFVQDVRFRRGLEGDLAQSIMSLSQVESARVHLSIARSSSFVVSDGEKSSASVVVTLRAGAELGAEQIAAIINMVAGSVAGLDPQRVTLVDQAGDLLSARVDLSEGYEASQASDAARLYQEQTRRSVRELLAPVLGERNYKMSVTADVDNDRIKETREQYGETPKVTSETLRQELDRDPLALGVPGSLSNRPIAIDPPADPAADSASKESASQRNASTRQYAYDRSVTQVQRSRGRLRKLNVAVVLNSSAAPGGAATWSAADLSNVENILRSGLGIDATRGDTLVVSTMPFPVQKAPAPWWQQPDTYEGVGSWLLYAIGLLLAFFIVVRPLMRIAQQRLAVVPGTVPAVEGPDAEPAVLPRRDKAAATSANASTPGGPIPVGPLLDDYDLPPSGSPVDVMVDHLKVLAAKEPERVAEVVRQWVQKNVRAE